MLASAAAAATAAVAAAAAAPGSKCAMVYTLSGEAHEIMFEPGEQVSFFKLQQAVASFSCPSCCRSSGGRTSPRRA